MEKKNKKTVGAHSLELSLQIPEKISIIEQQQAMQEDYMKYLLDIVDEGFKLYPGDFYVVVITKNEKLMPNVFRNYFFHRSTCPTPDYDQSVYRYNRSAERVEYIWTIPTKEACLYILDNQLIIDKSEHDLLNFVLDFKNGKLYDLAKKFNKEDEIAC